MFYIIEHQVRPDGVVNTSEVARQDEASALSYYYERYSKMVMTELYPAVSLLMTDQDLNVIKHDSLVTRWHPPVEDPS